MRHLRAILLDKVVRPIWSVLLPLVMRILNKTYKQSIHCTPHSLMFWAHTDLDRGIFNQFNERLEILPLRSNYVRVLEDNYERLLDITLLHILAEQEKLIKRYADIVITEFDVGSYVLVSYQSRPPLKLHTSWEGPFKVLSRVRNNVILKDLT